MAAYMKSLQNDLNSPQGHFQINFMGMIYSGTGFQLKLRHSSLTSRFQVLINFLTSKQK